MTKEDATRFKNTLALGKELAAGLDESDVLGRWMAHHLSELIFRARNAPIEERIAANQEAERAILRLWEHKTSLNMVHRPFENLAPVFRALTRLSEPQNPWDFYDTFHGGAEPTPKEAETNALLKIALRIEHDMREVVRELVVAAAATAAEREQEWLKHSEHLNTDHDIRRALELLRHLQSPPEEHLADKSDEDEVPSSLTAGTAKLLRKAAAQLSLAAELLQEPTINDPKSTAGDGLQAPEGHAAVLPGEDC